MGPAEPFQMIKGHYAAILIRELVISGAFPRLVQGEPSEAVAMSLGYDPSLFRSILHFVRATTGILVFEPPDTFRFDAACGQFDRFVFNVEKFLVAYNTCVERCAEILKVPTAGRQFIDSRSLATAFQGLHQDGSEAVAGLVGEWGVRSLLELGCGAGSFLAAMCRLDREFRGWGIDANGSMCVAAKERLSMCGWGSRVNVLHGNAEVAASILAEEDRAAVQALFARSLVNEFFTAGARSAVAFLAALRRDWVGRLFFIQDYYGKLSEGTVDQAFTNTLLQDLVQLLSGQGVPPPDLEGWEEVYSAAGCELLHVYEGSSGGIEGFIHVVRL